jgi:hypothetical protein
LHNEPEASAGAGAFLFFSREERKGAEGAKKDARGVGVLLCVLCGSLRSLRETSIYPVLFF